MRIGDGCATVTDYKLPQATVGYVSAGGKAGARFKVRSQDIHLTALVRPSRVGRTLLRNEKDEASPTFCFCRGPWDAFILRFARVKAFYCLCSALVSLKPKPVPPTPAELRKKDQHMQKSSVTNLIPASTLASVLLFPTLVVAQFASSVVSYNPGVGFQAGYNTASSALGEPSRVTPGLYGGPVDPFNPAYLASQLVSLGAGGSLTVEFNSPILNNPANVFGCDFNIFGNAGFIVTNATDFNGNFIGTPATDGSLFGHNPGATRVLVSADGINFFLLNPALAPMVDNLFPTDGSGDFSLPVNPALNAASFAGKTLADVRALYNSAAGGAGYDISWAQDGLGHSVSLASINFVRVEVLSGKAEVDGFVVVPEPTVISFALLGIVTLALRRKGR